MDHAHCDISWDSFYPDEDANAGHDALNIGLTFSSPAAYSLRS